PRVVTELVRGTGQAADPVTGGQQLRYQTASDVPGRPGDQAKQPFGVLRCVRAHGPASLRPPPGPFPAPVVRASPPRRARARRRRPGAGPAPATREGRRRRRSRTPLLRRPGARRMRRPPDSPAPADPPTRRIRRPLSRPP